MRDYPTMDLIGVLAPAGMEVDGTAADRDGRPAFAGLVERHAKDALAAAIGLLRDPHEAEEAVQEAFCRAWKALPTLREPGKFRGWFAGILYRVCCDALRRRRRDRRILPDVGRARPAEAPPAAGHGPVVEAALDLPDEYREPLVLYYLQELSVAELAQALGLSEANAKVRLHRARRMLRERLDRPGREGTLP
jgi:RNA polymerase sigma-70 factor (ECF subfamily)